MATQSRDQCDAANPNVQFVETKKSHHVTQPMAQSERPHDEQPPNGFRPWSDASAGCPIQAAHSGTIQSEKPTHWAERFSDNFLQPIIKCLSLSRVGCVGLRRGALLKYPQNIIFNWTEFCACVSFACISFFFFPSVTFVSG